MTKNLRRPRARALAALAAIAAAACSAAPTTSGSNHGATNDPASAGSTGRPGAGGGDGGVDGGGATADSGAPAAGDAGKDGGFCLLGPCPLVTTTQPLGISVDETTIYWRTGAGDLMRANVDGTGVSTVFSSPGAAAPSGATPGDQNGLLILSSRAYFPVNGPTQNFVQAALLDGTGGSTLDLDTNAAEREQAFALDATALYVAHYGVDAQGGGCADVGIDVVPLDGAPKTTLLGACAVVRLAVDASHAVYWTDRGARPDDIGPSLMRQAPSDAAPTKMATVLRPGGVAVYGGMLYWGDVGNIMTMPIGGGTQPSSLSASTAVGDIVVDSSGIYWIDSGSAVMTAPLTGGSPVALAQGQANVVGLATNATSVFWVNEGTAANGYADGTVVKIAK